MKISKIAVQNMGSFGSETSISLLPDFNIIIGPNGSGKTNTVRVLDLAFNHALIRHFLENKEPRVGKDIITFNATPSGHPSLLLNEHRNYGAELPQTIQLEVSFEEKDFENISIISRYRQQIYEVEKRLNGNNHSEIQGIFSTLLDD